MGARQLCAIEGCGRQEHVNGYCRRHWKRWHTYDVRLCGIGTCDTVGAAHEQSHTRNEDCVSFRGCGRPSASLGLCTLHYGRLSKHGDPNIISKSAKR